MAITPERHRTFRPRDERYFRTANPLLGAVLLASDAVLVNVDRANPGRCEFVFQQQFEVQELADRFATRQPLYVDARKFVTAWRVLRRKQHGERF